jgi:hypothetical protein
LIIPEKALEEPYKASYISIYKPSLNSRAQRFYTLSDFTQSENEAINAKVSDKIALIHSDESLLNQSYRFKMDLETLDD